MIIRFTSDASGRVARAGLIVGFALATIGLAVYQAWWTIAFGIGGVALALAAGRAAPGKAVAIGAAVAAFLALGMLGLFLVYGGLQPGGAACLPEECSNRGLGLLLVGVGALTVAALGLAYLVRIARRG